EVRAPEDIWRVLERALTSDVAQPAEFAELTRRHRAARRDDQFPVVGGIAGGLIAGDVEPHRVHCRRLDPHDAKRDAKLRGVAIRRALRCSFPYAIPFEDHLASILECEQIDLGAVRI